MTRWFKSCFVFSSFGPLYLIVWGKLWLTAGFCALPTLVFFDLGILAICMTAYLIKQLKTDAGYPLHVKDVESVDSEIFPYLMTYIPVFLESDLSDASFLYPAIALYVMIFVLFLKLDTPYLHPYFALFGLRIYKARSVTEERTMIIIAKGRRLSGSEDLYLYEVGTADLYYCDTTLRYN